jgi:hypothetical protein
MLINLSYSENIGLFGIVVCVFSTKKRKKIYSKKQATKYMYVIWPNYEKNENGDIMAIALECKDFVDKKSHWLTDIKWANVHDSDKPLRYDSRWPNEKNLPELDKQTMEDLDMLFSDTIEFYWYGDDFKYSDKKIELERQKRQKRIKGKFAKIIEDNRSTCVNVRDAYDEKLHQLHLEIAKDRGWDPSSVPKQKPYSAYGRLESAIGGES